MGVALKFTAVSPNSHRTLSDGKGLVEGLDTASVDRYLCCHPLFANSAAPMVIGAAEASFVDSQSIAEPSRPSTSLAPNREAGEGANSQDAAQEIASSIQGGVLAPAHESQEPADSMPDTTLQPDASGVDAAGTSGACAELALTGPDIATARDLLAEEDEEDH